jgi:hypothetical protein
MQTVMVPYGSSLLHAARNEALAKMNPVADYAVMIDDDMLPEPDAIWKILRHEAPVAVGICTTRSKPVQLALKAWDPDAHQFVHMDQIRGMHAADPDRSPTIGQFGVGAAFLALRKDTVERLIEHYLSAQDWVMDNERTFRRMKVNPFQIEVEAARIEAKRRHLYAEHAFVRIFDYPVDDAQWQLGEDIGFSTRLIQLGIKVLVDPEIAVGHMGDYPFGIKDYIPKTTQKLRSVNIAETFKKLA